MQTAPWVTSPGPPFMGVHIFQVGGQLFLSRGSFPTQRLNLGLCTAGRFTKAELIKGNKNTEGQPIFPANSNPGLIAGRFTPTYPESNFYSYTISNETHVPTRIAFREEMRATCYFPCLGNQVVGCDIHGFILFGPKQHETI